MQVYYENSQVRVTSAVLIANGRQCQIRQIERIEAVEGEQPSWGPPALGIIIGAIVIFSGIFSTQAGNPWGPVAFIVGVVLMLTSLKSLFSLRSTCYLIINHRQFYASKNRREIIEIQLALNKAMEHGI